MRWSIEYTMLVFSDSIIIEATTKDHAILKFWEQIPGATRVVSIVPEGEPLKGTFHERLALARMKRT